ncbi:unnamed protein product, partial [Acanthocheilonema viteae]
KNRWSRNPEAIAPNWVKQYNKFGRIDGHGFNYMRRDFRVFYEQAYAEKKDFTKSIKKFPSEPKLKLRSHQKKKSSSGKKETKKNVKIEKLISKLSANVGQSTSKQSEVQVEEDEDIFEYFDFDDDSSEDENESYDVPSSLLTELKRDCIKKSVAANIALEIMCSTPTQLTLKRLLTFEKHQLVTEWEIAKKTYCLRDLDWEVVPGMINLCDEVAKEMVEIDRVLEAIRCLGRCELAANLMPILKKSVKAELQRKGAPGQKEEVHSSDSEEGEVEKSKESEDKTKKSEESVEHEKEEREKSEDETEESEESEKDEAEESEKSDATSDNSSSSSEIEELKIVTDEKYEKEVMKVKKYLANTFIDLLRGTQFFTEILSFGEKKDEEREIGYSNYQSYHSNYQFYRMLSSMTHAY